jgi:hypothetical protein
MEHRADGAGFDPDRVWRTLAGTDPKVLDGRTFRLYGPTAPPPDSPHAPMLASWSQQNEVLVEVELSHGSLLAADGPYVAVKTTLTEAGQGQYPLREVVQDERDRLFTHAGLDEDQLGGQAAEVESEVEAWLAVDGVPVRAVLRVEGRLWAARLSLGGPDFPLRDRGGEPVTITVTGRGVAPERVGLCTVEELAPYARGRHQWLAALVDRRGPQTHVRDRELPQAVGLEAHHRLVDVSVRDALQHEADLEAGRSPGRPPRDGVSRGELWEIAVRQQMRLSGEDRETANQAVTLLVNQMIRLAARTAWFPGTDHAAAAVEESVRHTVFGSEVPSLQAQHAWRVAWDERRTRTGDRRREADEQWLDQWRRWRHRRQG